MPTNRTTPLLQVRVIGPEDQARDILAGLGHRVRTVLGTAVTCTTQTRAARRAGHVRIYLTATRKEPGADDYHD